MRRRRQIRREFDRSNTALIRKNNFVCKLPSSSYIIKQEHEQQQQQREQQQ